MRPFAGEESDKSGIMEKLARLLGILEAHSQLPVRFAERNRAFDMAAQKRALQSGQTFTLQRD